MALNTHFLLILGRFLEGLIGSARFLLPLRGLGAVGQPGGSGAVWGLLGAHAVLILECVDIAQLDVWADRVLLAESLADVFDA